LAEVKAQFVELNKNRYSYQPEYVMVDRENESDCWYYQETGGADYWYSIEEHKIED
jgi:hypothetical protein